MASDVVKRLRSLLGDGTYRDERIHGVAQFAHGSWDELGRDDAATADVWAIEAERHMREAADEIERLEGELEETRDSIADLIKPREDRITELEAIVEKMPDIRATTVSRTGLQVTIDCDLYEEAAAWMEWLMNDAARAATGGE